MSEYEDDFEIDDEAQAAPEAEIGAEVEAIDELENAADSADGAEAEDAVAIETPRGGEAAGETAAEGPSADEQLWDKANKAARLLRNRKNALQKEKEDRGGRPTLLVRALRLLQLKPKMEQKEMSDLLGVKLRELDAVLAEAEKNDIVSRIDPEQEDLRKVVVMADESSMALAQAAAEKGERFVPGLSDEDEAQLLALLDKVIDPLVALGLDDERAQGDGAHGRGGREGDRGNRNGRGGFGGRGGRDRDERNGRGGRGGFGGSRGGYDRDRGNRNDRGGYRGGSRGGYRDRDDRGSRGGFGARSDRDRDRNGRGDRGGSFRSNRGNRY